MARSRRLLVTTLGLVVSISLSSVMSMTVEAGSNRNYLDSLNGGVAALLSMENNNAAELINTTMEEISQKASEQIDVSTLVISLRSIGFNVADPRESFFLINGRVNISPPPPQD